MEPLGKIRRRYLVQGESIRSIARYFHLSRNTIRKYLRNGSTPTDYKRQQQPKPRLAAFEPQLGHWL